MQPSIVWQQGSNNPANADNFATISQWWTSLNGKKIAWRQRLIPQSGDLGEIDWEPQRFDEVCELQFPQVRGITLYWRKPDSEQERSTTPRLLALNPNTEQLYIYPQSQKDLIIRVGVPEIVYQTIEMTNPEWMSGQSGENYTLTLRDKRQQLAVKLTLTPENLAQLKAQLPE